jgi:sulfur carrier protein
VIRLYLITPASGDPAPAVAALLQHLGVRGDRVAVERNGEVVKKARHGEQRVAPDDVLEIVTFVGGG